LTRYRLSVSKFEYVLETGRSNNIWLYYGPEIEQVSIFPLLHQLSKLSVVAVKVFIPFGADQDSRGVSYSLSVVISHELIVCLFCDVKTLHFHFNLEVPLVDLGVVDLNCEALLEEIIYNVCDGCASGVGCVLFECVSEDCDLSGLWVLEAGSNLLG
jgi:hypothetical protein